MRIEVVNIGPSGAESYEVDVPAGALAKDALAKAGITLMAGLGLAVYGRRIDPETVLKDGDRLEAAGALLCDPKLVRKDRATAQGDVRVVTCGRHGGRRRLEKTVSQDK